MRDEGEWGQAWKAWEGAVGDRTQAGLRGDRGEQGIEEP